jgi:hypothetical protein
MNIRVVIKKTVRIFKRGIKEKKKNREYMTIAEPLLRDTKGERLKRETRRRRMRRNPEKKKMMRTNDT